jgi:hypothetical protein
MSQLPVAESIRKGAKVVDLDRKLTGVDRTEIVRRSVEFKSRVPIEATVASDIYWSSTSFFDDDQDFPSVRSPYPRMWIEWTAPKVFREGNKWFDMPANCLRNYFALVDEFDSDKLRSGWYELGGIGQSIVDGMPKNATRTIISCGGGIAGAEVGIFPGALIAHTDDDGNLVGFVRGSTGEWHTGVAGVGGNPDDMCTLNNLKVGLIAVGLMNCKNVTTKERNLNLARSGRQKRNREPQVKYRTIQLPGSQPNRGSSSRKLSGPTDISVHRVRGHFKTFTTEKPLLGRHVGTYWWGWQVRGNAENGVVVSDYKIGVS